MTYTSPAPRCPECGAAYRLGGSRCWLCGGRLPQDQPRDEPPRPRPTSHYGEIVEATVVMQETSATFSLSSLFLVLTLAAVAAGTFAAAPGLGILFLVVATPALARTLVISSRWKRLGVASTPSEKVFSFLRSTAIVLVILLGIIGALGIALFMACTGAVAGGLLSNSISKEPDAGFVAGAAAGGLVALAGIGAILWAVWNGRRGSR